MYGRYFSVDCFFFLYSALQPFLEGTTSCLQSLQGLSSLLQTNLDINGMIDFIITVQLFCDGGKYSQ